jgi:gas vesicle protein
MSRRGGLGSLLLGGAIGAGIALLFTTKKGEELRKDLLDKITELCDKLKDIDSEEVKSNVEKKVQEIKDGIRDLDAEKVKKTAAKKAEELKKKAEDLVVYAKEKGEPALIDSSEAVLKRVIKVSKDALKKLEEKEKVTKTKTKKEA